MRKFACRIACLRFEQPHESCMQMIFSLAIPLSRAQCERGTCITTFGIPATNTFGILAPLWVGGTEYTHRQFRFNPLRVSTSFVSTLSAARCSEDQMQDLAYLMGHQRSTARASYTVGMMTRKIERILSLISTHCNIEQNEGAMEAAADITD